MAGPRATTTPTSPAPPGGSEVNVMKPAPDVIMRVSEVLGHVRKPVPVLRVSPIVAALDRPEASLDRETVPRVALSLVKAFAEIPTRVMPVDPPWGAGDRAARDVRGPGRGRQEPARRAFPTDTDAGPCSGGYRQPHLVSVSILPALRSWARSPSRRRAMRSAAFTTLLDDLDLTDVLITADGAHTQPQPRRLPVHPATAAAGAVVETDWRRQGRTRPGRDPPDQRGQRAPVPGPGWGVPPVRRPSHQGCPPSTRTGSEKWTTVTVTRSPP